MVSSAKPISCCCSSGVRNLISGGLSLSDELISGMYHVCEGGSISFVRPKDCWRS